MSDVIVPPTQSVVSAPQTTPRSVVSTPYTPYTQPEVAEVQRIETAASPIDDVLTAKPAVVIIDKCAFRLEDIQCILLIDHDDYDYEVFFVGGNNIYIDKETANTLMELL